MRTHLTLLALALLAACATTPEAPAPIVKRPVDAPVHRSWAELPPIDAPLLVTTRTPEQLAAACEEAEKSADAKLAALVAIPDTERTFEGTVGGLEQIVADYTAAVGRVTFMNYIHPDEKVRAAGAACEERSGKYAVRLAARKDLYQAVKGWQANAGATAALDPQDQRLAMFTLRDFRRSGLELSDADRDELTRLRSRLAELQTQFASNLAADTSSITAKESELKGLSKELIARLPKNADGTRTLTTKYPDYYPVMETAKNAELRRRMQVAFASRGMPRNLELLNEALVLRQKAAKLLGYPTHADYVLEVNMAKTPKTVADFEQRLIAALKPRLAADTAKMEALKAKETGGKDRRINSWDWRYYLNEIKKSEYALDDELVRAYFPADVVMQGMFEVYQRLFSVEFKELPLTDAWADGVKLYEVREQGGGRLLAKFYVDLYPRPGKYGHAAAFDFGLARARPDGYQIPISALVVNFTPAKPGEVSRLSTDEVDTLFHEFGHIVHMSLTTARYASLSGANTARDFVEAPSQMLQNWVFEPEVLALISRDPKDPKKTMPEALVKKVIATRTFDSGVKYTRQLFLGTFDQNIHTAAAIDADVEAKRLWLELTGFAEDPNEHFAAGFGHMMGGYDAGYYGYLFSLVFASDMYAHFQTEGVLNAATGRRYRDEILAKGRTEDADVLLRKFLGREPNEAAFLKLAGIE